MTPRRHAETTTVPVSKTRSEIDELLRAWDCEGVRWTDFYKEGRTRLEFVWQPPNEDPSYMARFDLALEDGDLSRQRREQEWCRIHRVLRVYLLAQFNAVEAGLLTTEEVLLGHVVGPNDRTVGEQLLPRLRELTGSSAVGLLEAGR